MESLIEELHCPYCGSDLALDRTTRTSAGHVWYGTVRCECYRYPIVEGILVLRQNSGPGDTNDDVVHLIEQGQTDKALDRALNSLSMTAGRARPIGLGRLLNRAAGVIGSLVQGLGRADRPRAEGEVIRSFYDDLRRFRTDTYADYLFHRYANNSFLAAVPFVLLLGHLAAVRRTAYGPDEATRTFRVLDLGCGAGHSAFLLRSLMPDGSVVAADFDFANLYFAGRHLVSGAKCICMDAEAPLAFGDGAFDAIFCLDAFHYFRAKRAVSAELQRVLGVDGTLVLAHLHNAAGSNRTPGIPLSIDQYRRCFEDMPQRVMSESDVLADFVRAGKVDLQSEISADRLRGSDVVTLVASRCQAIWRTYTGLDAQLYSGSQRRLTLNPIFHSRQRAERVQLSMHWPNPFLEEECASVTQYVPAQCEIDEGLLRRATEGTAVEADIPAIANLVRSFVLVRLPEAYA